MVSAMNENKPATEDRSSRQERVVIYIEPSIEEDLPDKIKFEQ